jgi:hypothetical protein
METFRWVPLAGESSPLQRVRRASGQRHNRPRRASSMAVISTGAGGGPSGVGGGAYSREASGNFSQAHTLAHGPGSGPSGRLPSRAGSTGVNSSNANVVQPGAHGLGQQWQSPAPAMKGYRAASANVALTSLLSGHPPPDGHSAAAAATPPAGPGCMVGSLPGAGSLANSRPRGPGQLGAGPASGSQQFRRKPHRSCSTTALAYRGPPRPA